MNICGNLVVLVVFAMASEFATAQRRPVTLAIRPVEVAVATNSTVSFTCSSNAVLTGCEFRVRRHALLDNRNESSEDGPVLACTNASLASPRTVHDGLGRALYTAEFPRSVPTGKEFGVRLTDVAKGRYLVGCRARAEHGGWVEAYSTLNVQENIDAFEPDHDGVELAINEQSNDTATAVVTADLGSELVACEFYLPGGRVVRLDELGSLLGQQGLQPDGAECSAGPARQKEELNGPLWVVATFRRASDTIRREAHFMKMIAIAKPKRAVLTLNLPQAKNIKTDGTNSTMNGTVSRTEITNPNEGVGVDITDDTEADLIDIDGNDDTERGSGDKDLTDPDMEKTIPSRKFPQFTTKDDTKEPLSELEAAHVFTEGDILRATCSALESRLGADIIWTFGDVNLTLDAGDWTVSSRNNSAEWTWPWETKAIEQTISKRLEAADEGKTLKCTVRFLDGDGNVQKTKESATKLLRLVAEQAPTAVYMIVIVVGVVSFLAVVTVVTAVAYVWLTNKCCFALTDANPATPEQLAMKRRDESPANLKATHVVVADETCMSHEKAVRSDSDETCLSSEKAVRSDSDETCTSPEKAVRPDLDETCMSSEKAVRPDSDETCMSSEKAVRPDSDETCTSPEKTVIPDSDETLTSPDEEIDQGVTGNKEIAPDNVYSDVYDHVRNRSKPGQPGFNQTKPVQTE